DAERQIPHSNRFSDRIESWKQFLRDRFAKNDDSCRRSNVGVGEKLALLHFPASNLGELLIRALHPCKPVLITINELAGCIDDWGSSGDGWNFALNRFHIFFRQGVRGTCP